MDQVLDFLRCVPDTIWAALIASLIAFVGVVLANRNSRKIVELNLLHNREQMDKERLMRLRQEVYLPGAEAINAVYSSVGTLINPEVPDSEVAEKFSKANAYLSKISLIGSSQTHAAASKLNNVLRQHLMKVMGKRLPIMTLHARITTCRELINRSANEKDRFIAIMKEINLHGQSDPGQMDRLQKLFDIEQANFEKYMANKQELQTKIAEKILTLRYECLQAAKEISGYFPAAIGAAREEMEIPFDADTYVETLEESFQSAREALDEYLNNVIKQQKE